MSSAVVEDEIISINAIYGPETLIKSSNSDGTYILRIPVNEISLRLAFPHDYPDSPPAIEGSEASGINTKKGTATKVVKLSRGTLGHVFRPGEPCIYDLLEELGTTFSSFENAQDADQITEAPEPDGDLVQQLDPQEASQLPEEEPPWVLSTAITEKKSVFLARAAHVSSPAEAKRFIRHLVQHDKKAAKATHNITAWRIQGPSQNNGVDADVTFQDCDDDGETAAGGRLLHLLQMMDAWNIVVVVSRWYGGIQLGPDRFRIISTVARESVLNGGFVEAGSKDSKKGKK